MKVSLGTRPALDAVRTGDVIRELPPLLYVLVFSGLIVADTRWEHQPEPIIVPVEAPLPPPPPEPKSHEEVFQDWEEVAI